MTGRLSGCYCSFSFAFDQLFGILAWPNDSFFRTLEQEIQEIQGPPHVASGTETVGKATLNRDMLRLVLKSLAELTQSCLEVHLELQLICRLRDNPSWCGTDGRHDGSTIASWNLHLKSCLVYPAS
jgi:hypothetical protein